MLPFGVGFTEMILLAFVAVMLFGGRLPEVAKQLGESYVQFRRGLDDIKNSINADSEVKSSSVTSLPDYSSGSSGNAGGEDGAGGADDFEEPSAPVFQPPEDDE